MIIASAAAAGAGAASILILFFSLRLLFAMLGQRMMILGWRAFVRIASCAVFARKSQGKSERQDR
jgi:hypothetical protein